MVRPARTGGQEPAGRFHEVPRPDEVIPAEIIINPVVGPEVITGAARGQGRSHAVVSWTRQPPSPPAPSPKRESSNRQPDGNQHDCGGLGDGGCLKPQIVDAKRGIGST